jgi:ATP-dependent Lhr-like helicase
VVLDDLHLIDGTYRGDQLRVLLERLRLRKECASIQYAAMTATAAEPQTLAQRYFNPVTVVEAGTRRAVQLKLFETLQELVSYARKLKITKILFFTNSRIDAEVLFKSLSDLWPRDRILIHHGSLSKKIREEVEGTMRSWSWGICISTTTLEIGIDIGDIDAVAILYPPFFASSFQQRIGRGSRTKNEISVLGLYRDQGEKQIFELYCEMANLGLVEQSLYMPDLSVVVQQLFSILFERRRGITENELFTNVCTLCTRDEYSAILNYLISRQFLEERAMKILGSEKIMNLGERGLIHSNIPDSREREIVDFNTGRVMGKASIGVSGASYFVFAGRLWRAKEVTAKRIVAVQAGGSVEIKNFLKRPEKGAFSDYLPPDLREL